MRKSKLLKKEFILASGYRRTIIHHGEATNSWHGRWIKKLREYIFNHSLKADSKKWNEVGLSLCTLKYFPQSAVNSFMCFMLSYLYHEMKAYNTLQSCIANISWQKSSDIFIVDVCLCTLNHTENNSYKLGLM